jgi:hypothetical protein
MPDEGKIVKSQIRGVKLSMDKNKSKCNGYR